MGKKKLKHEAKISKERKIDNIKLNQKHLLCVPTKINWSMNKEKLLSTEPLPQSKVPAFNWDFL